MKTVLKTIPGFFSADTNDDGKNPDVPVGKLHIHTVTIETYELDGGSDLNLQFSILAALPSLLEEKGEPHKAKTLKRILRQLGDNLQSNADNFK